MKISPFVKLLQGFLTASFSQLAISASGFAWTYFLLHSLEPDDFGVFSVIQALSLLLSGLLGAWFVLPWLVRLPKNDEAQTVLIIKTWVSYLMVPFFVVVPIVIFLYHFFPGNVFLLVAFLGLALVPRDYFIRASIAGGVAIKSLWPNVAMLAFVVVAIWMVDAFNTTLTLDLAVFIVAVSAFASPVFGYISLALVATKKSKFNLPSTDIAVQERIVCALSYFVGWIQAQAIVMFVFVALSKEAAALIAAARLTVAPFVLMAPVVNNLIMHHFRGSDMARRRSVWINGSWLIAFGSLVYICVLWLTFDWIVAVTVPQTLTLPFSVVFGIVLLSSLQLIRDVSRSVLYSLFRSSDVLRDSIAGALLMVVLLWGAAVNGNLGLDGFVFMAVLSEFAFVLLIVRRTGLSISKATA